MIRKVLCITGEFSSPLFHVKLKYVFYSFDVKWLKDGVSTLADIETHPDLSNKEKKYLKAILQRSGIGPLPKEPSKLDIQELVKAYGMFL